MVMSAFQTMNQQRQQQQQRAVDEFVKTAVMLLIAMDTRDFMAVLPGFWRFCEESIAP